MDFSRSFSSLFFVQKGKTALQNRQIEIAYTHTEVFNK